VPLGVGDSLFERCDDLGTESIGSETFARNDFDSAETGHVGNLRECRLMPGKSLIDIVEHFRSRRLLIVERDEVNRFRISRPIGSQKFAQGRQGDSILDFVEVTGGMSRARTAEHQLSSSNDEDHQTR
jgi:hypothetical protein